MPRFCGLDIHKKEVQAVLIDDTGKVLLRQRFLAIGSVIQAFARNHLTQEDHVALEATTNTWPIVALLQPLVKQVVVSNPMRTKAIAQAKIKTDKVDALVLAQLLRADFLPSVWIPPDETRRMRQRATERSMLMNDRTRIKNRIHAILHQRLIEAPTGDLFSTENLAWLRGSSIPLEPQGRAALDRQLRLFDALQPELETVTQSAAANAYDTPQIKLLMTLPGFDFCVAEALLAALGDFTRFPNADKAASYLGLVPSTYQSGDHCYHGRITKQGRSNARWMMVQAAQSAALHPGPLGAFFRKIAKKKSRNVAIVATARKLVTIAWHMLHNNEPYRYAVPSTLDAKFARLRILATGEKSKRGSSKGTPRSANYGTGIRTRAVPGLAEIYLREGLPANVPLEDNPAELRALQQHEPSVLQHARQVSVSRRVPRRRSSTPAVPAKQEPANKP
jgi:transposase